MAAPLEFEDDGDDEDNNKGNEGLEDSPVLGRAAMAEAVRESRSCVNSSRYRLSDSPEKCDIVKCSLDVLELLCEPEANFEFETSIPREKRPRISLSSVDDRAIVLEKSVLQAVAQIPGGFWVSSKPTSNVDQFHRLYCIGLTTNRLVPDETPSFSSSSFPFALFELFELFEPESDFHFAEEDDGDDDEGARPAPRFSSIKLNETRFSSLDFGFNSSTFSSESPPPSLALAISASTSLIRCCSYIFDSLPRQIFRFFHKKHKNSPL